MSDSVQRYGLQPSRLLCLWDSPGKNTGVGCCTLLQGIEPSQGSNSHLLQLLNCKWILYRWATREAPSHVTSWQIDGKTVEAMTDCTFLSHIHIRMWELDHKEGWAPENRCFRTVVLGKTLESAFDNKVIKPVTPKGNQPQVFSGDSEGEGSLACCSPWGCKKSDKTV